MALNFNALRLVRRVVAGWVIIYVLTSLSVGGSAGAKGIFYAVAAGWILVLVANAVWKTRNRAADRIRRTTFFIPDSLLVSLEVVLTNVALTIVLLEASLRLYSQWAGTSLLLNDTLDAYRLVPLRDYGAGLRGNRLGYPGPDWDKAKKSGTYRIVSLGDSFAVGPVVPFADNYLTLLYEDRPEVEVLNLGVSGCGPREYRAIFNRDGRHYQPDLLLVSVFVGNDITESLATPRHLDPRSFCNVSTDDPGLAIDQGREGRKVRCADSLPIEPACSNTVGLSRSGSTPNGDMPQRHNFST